MLQNPYTELDDGAVHRSLLALAKLERDTGVAIILHLLLVKERKLYAAWGHDSVFSYCTERLGFSRSSAYRRKVVLETVTAFPSLLSRLTDGRLQLCAAAAVAPHLTAQNAEELLDAVQGLSHREVEAYLVRRRARREGAEPAKAPVAAPSPLGLFGTEAETPATLSDTAAEKPLPLPRTTIKPLTEEASRVHVTLTEPTLALLVRAKELLAGKPDDEVLGRALAALLERLAPERRHARRESARERRAAKAPRSGGPRATASQAAPNLESSRRGKLADRDAAAVDGGGLCSYVGLDRHRCTARGFLQTDHVIPWSKGGPSQRWNFAPLCATHNAFKGAKLPASQWNAAPTGREAEPEPEPPR